MSSPTDEKLGGDLKAALEAIAGRKIDASSEQLRQQIIKPQFPFSNYSFTPPRTAPSDTNVGEVVSRSFVVILPPVCSGSELLDVSGVT